MRHWVRFERGRGAGRPDVRSERGPTACRQDRLRALRATRGRTLGCIVVCDQEGGGDHLSPLGADADVAWYWMRVRG